MRDLPFVEIKPNMPTRQLIIATLYCSGVEVRLQCVAVGLQWGFKGLQCVIVCCSVLQCAAVCSSVMQCVAMCCKTPG